MCDFRYHIFIYEMHISRPYTDTILSHGSMRNRRWWKQKRKWKIHLETWNDTLKSATIYLIIYIMRLTLCKYAARCCKWYPLLMSKLQYISIPGLYRLFFFLSMDAWIKPSWNTDTSSYMGIVQSCYLLPSQHSMVMLHWIDWSIKYTLSIILFQQYNFPSK